MRVKYIICDGGKYNDVLLCPAEPGHQMKAIHPAALDVEIAV